MSMTRINFYIDSRMLTRFDAYAARVKRPRSDIIRGALEAGETAVADLVQRRTSPRKLGAERPSALELIAGDQVAAAPAAPEQEQMVSEVRLLAAVRKTLERIPNKSAESQHDSVIASFPAGSLGPDPDQRIEAAFKTVYSESADTDRNFQVPEE